jgi:hypothetical protein
MIPSEQGFMVAYPSRMSTPRSIPSGPKAAPPSSSWSPWRMCESRIYRLGVARRLAIDHDTLRTINRG